MEGEDDGGDLVCEALVPDGAGALSRSSYVCDKRFHVELVEEFFARPDDEPPKRHGLVVATGDRAEFWVLSEALVLCDAAGAGAKKGKGALERVGAVEMCRQKREKKGGQSAARFGRIRENQIASFVKLVAESCVQHFVDGSGQKATVLTLCSGGSGGAQIGIFAQLCKSPHLPPCLQSIVVGSWALDDPSAQKLAERSADARASRSGDADKAVQRVLRLFETELLLSTDGIDGATRAVYGYEALEAAAAAHQIESFVASRAALSRDERLAKVLALLKADRKPRGSSGGKTAIYVLDSNPKVLQDCGGAIALAFFPIAL